MDSDTLKLLNAFNQAADRTVNGAVLQAEEPNFSDGIAMPNEVPVSTRLGNSDREIINAFLNRNEQAISAAMQKYGRTCTAMAQRFLRNREDAEQCVNDALLKTWESIPPNNPRELLPYLSRIIKNLSLNRLRAENSLKRGGGAVSGVLDELSDSVSGSDCAEDLFETKELRSAVNKFLGTLKSSHRQMFLLRYWFCCEVPEIAERLEISEGTVAVTLTRTRKKFKAYLEKRGYNV